MVIYAQFPENCSLGEKVSQMLDQPELMTDGDIKVVMLQQA